MVVLSILGLMEVRIRTCLSHWTMQCLSDVALSPFGNVTEAAKLGRQLAELLVGGRKGAAEGLKKSEKMLWCDAACPKQLKSTPFHTHDEVSFGGCSLSYNLVPSKQRVDRFPRSAREGEHLGHAGETGLFFECCEPCMKCTEQVGDGIELYTVANPTVHHLLW